jgi:transcriptional regulator GlxA family with amidase domain
MKATTLVLLLIFCIISCTNQNAQKNKTNRELKIKPDRYNVGFLIMDGTFNTEFTAPFDIFQHTQYRENIKAMNVFTVANTLEPITTFEGVKILPDFDYTSNNMPEIDILVIPSAEHHIDSDLNDVVMISFVKKVDEKALYMTSHCDGAFVLAKAGLLDTIASTTFPGDLDKYQKMFPQLNVKKNSYFVHDGKYITSAGGAKSFEASLYLCEVLYGKEIAESLAKGLVIDWDVNKVPHFITP